MSTEKKRLGRGLDALLGEIDAPNEGGTATATDGTRVPVDRIQNNPFQPRQAFDDDEIKALSQSLQTHGLLQPLVVRPKADGGFELIAGERRLRAARVAGWTDIPVQVVNFNDQQVLEAALVENIQRTDLNPIEKALGFREYLTRFKLTHEELAARIGLDRSTITNLLRLIDLPTEVQDAVRVGQISSGHARALASLSDPQRQVEICKEIIARGHSVRATEMLVKEQRPEREPAEASDTPAPVEKTAHVQSLEDEFRQRLAMKIQIRLKARDKGQVVLTFESNDDFERLIEQFRK